VGNILLVKAFVMCKTVLLQNWYFVGCLLLTK